MNLKIMTKYTLLLVMLLTTTGLWAAEKDGPSQRFAVGLNTSWSSQRSYGARTFRRFDPEMVAFLYGGLPLDRFWWRGGLRLGYATEQPEMPQSVRIEETDTKMLADFGVTFDWYIVPSLSFGAGYDNRTTRLKTQCPIDVDDSRINRKDRLLYRYAQLGAGLPILSGAVMFELVARYFDIAGDDRSHYSYGVETTVGF